VIEEQDVANSIYEVPVELVKQDVDVYVLELLNMHVHPLELTDWTKMLERRISPKNGEVEIAVVGKYIALQDSYKSIYEALVHGGIANSVKVNIRMIESEDIEEQGLEKMIGGVDGVLVPGGFGHRGTEGKIQAVQYARENKLPFFGICLGMQCAVMEFGRNMCGMDGANSTEFDADTKFPVIDLMDDQKEITAKGGTMRLGSYPCKVAVDTKSKTAYGSDEISERHRHRYEFNNKYRDEMAAKGLSFSGLSPDGNLVEMVELKDHPWFVACQFHPEFQSTPLKAHPLFRDFIAAAMK
jgi:CTP synthase